MPAFGTPRRVTYPHRVGEVSWAAEARSGCMMANDRPSVEAGQGVLKPPHNDRRPCGLEVSLQGRLEVEVGGDVLSHRVPPAVPSALWGLTAVFGMGTGVSPTLQPPTNQRCPWAGDGASGAEGRPRASVCRHSGPVGLRVEARGRSRAHQTSLADAHGWMSVTPTSPSPSKEQGQARRVYGVSNEDRPGKPVKPLGGLVRLGFTCHHASTCRLST